MTTKSRREFLVDVGKGMLVAGIGWNVAMDLGLCSTSFAMDPEPLSFGPLEPLVCLMQETPLDALLPKLVQQLQQGTELRQLVAAAALANARTFGGEDYVGYHAMMALAPAYFMALELPKERQALPVLKVLYRNTKQIHAHGGRKGEVLQQVEPSKLTAGPSNGEQLRDVVRGKDMNAAEGTFAAMAKGKADDAFNALLYAVHDNIDVHRIVLPYRSYAMIDLVGSEHAHTLLRQSLRYCVRNECRTHQAIEDLPRTVLPKVLDQYGLLGKSLGTRHAEDAWVAKLSELFFESSPEQAADAAGAALSEGFAPSTVMEAITIAANQLVLRDAGRSEQEARPGKPVGSVHGDSIGVHACDSANAWRNMARVGDHRNSVASVVLAAYQVASDRTNRGGDFLNWKPRPWAEERQSIKSTEPEALLREADAAIRANDQAKASALVHRYGELGLEPRPVFDLLLRYAVSEEGALHAEKYYRTASEEFSATRPAFRWRQLTALARVTASEYGTPAEGYAEACDLLRT